ncbi:MAG: c-type cytochrome [Polyangiaceae bacterium]|nr:c-type cytochrome [Polyangiaceae bacterium]
MKRCGHTARSARRLTSTAWLVTACSVLVAVSQASACGDGADLGPAPSSVAASSSAISSPATTSSPVTLQAPARALEAPLTGGLVARFPGTESIVIADEDHRALRIASDASTVDSAGGFATVQLPGPPANVVAWNDTILVTVRDPGLLVKLRVEGGSVREVGKTPLPPDAWGLAVSKDGKRAVVTSAYANKVAAVDIDAMTADGSTGPVWIADTTREPRGVVIAADGKTAWISHIVGSRLTKLDGVDTSAATVSRVDLAASALRAPSGKSLSAALGYALALSPDGKRLFAPRHALGAMGREAWFGAATVDVLRTDTASGIAPLHQGNALMLRSSIAKETETPDTLANLPAEPLAPFTQPRDIRYRTTTRTLLVAGEGDNVVAELDALALDPTLSVMRTYKIGSDVDPNLGTARSGGAPSGIALSEDERFAYVFCRSTYDFVRIPLSTDPLSAEPPAPIQTVRIDTDPLSEDAAKGRRLFYDATDRITSGGLACAGCHPEGRDDGHVWHEASFDTPDGGTRANFVGTYENVPDLAKTKGFPRRTAWLVGRVDAQGPYGWRAESATLGDRIQAGMGLHRWGGLPAHEPANVAARSAYLTIFLRKGLVPPARSTTAELGPLERRGKEVFGDATAACASCHKAETSFTDRVAHPLAALPLVRGFDDEPKQAFKTPSLAFVGNRGPYFHDGSATSLERLIDNNKDRMGKTTHLSEADRAALVAYLKTL